LATNAFKSDLKVAEIEKKLKTRIYENNFINVNFVVNGMHKSRYCIFSEFLDINNFRSSELYKTMPPQNNTVKTNDFFLLFNDNQLFTQENLQILT